MMHYMAYQKGNVDINGCFLATAAFAALSGQFWLVTERLGNCGL